MTQPKKPDFNPEPRMAYGTLLAGHDVPLGIGALKAAITACPPGKNHPPQQLAGWPRASTASH